MSDLYFIRMGEGPVKIGHSVDVKTRMACFQVGSPYPLTLLAVVQDEGFEEATWHEAFYADRLNGEWFEWSEALAEAITKAATAGTRAALDLAPWAPPAHWSKPWNLPALEAERDRRMNSVPA